MKTLLLLSEYGEFAEAYYAYVFAFHFYAERL